MCLTVGQRVDARGTGCANRHSGAVTEHFGHQPQESTAQLLVGHLSCFPCCVGRNARACHRKTPSQSHGPEQYTGRPSDRLQSSDRYMVVRNMQVWHYWSPRTRRGCLIAKARVKENQCEGCEAYLNVTTRVLKKVRSRGERYVRVCWELGEEGKGRDGETVDTTLGQAPARQLDHLVETDRSLIAGTEAPVRGGGMYSRHRTSPLQQRRVGRRINAATRRVEAGLDRGPSVGRSRERDQVVVMWRRRCNRVVAGNMDGAQPRREVLIGVTAMRRQVRSGKLQSGSRLIVSTKTPTTEAKEAIDPPPDRTTTLPANLRRLKKSRPSGRRAQARSARQF